MIDGYTPSALEVELPQHHLGLNIALVSQEVVILKQIVIHHHALSRNLVLGLFLETDSLNDRAPRKSHCICHCKLNTDEYTFISESTLGD
jgi:hypothetical protein